MKLPNFNFMFCLKILIPYSRFSNIYYTDLQDFSTHAFSDMFNISESQHFDIFKHICFEKGSDFLALFGVSWCLQRWIISVWGSHGHVHQAQKHIEMVTFRVFPKLLLKNQRWSKIVLRRCWPILSITLTIKIAPKTPQTPKPQFSRISWIFYRDPVMYFQYVWKAIENKIIWTIHWYQ